MVRQPPATSCVGVIKNNTGLLLLQRLSAMSVKQLKHFTLIYKAELIMSISFLVISLGSLFHDVETI